MNKNLIWVFFCLAIFSACKKDTEITIPTEEKIIGTWDWVKTEEQNIPDSGAPSTISTIHPYGAYWSFKGFGVLQYANTNVNFNGTWALVNDTSMLFTTQPAISAKIIELNQHLFVFNYEFKYNGGKTIITQYLSR